MPAVILSSENSLLLGKILGASIVRYRSGNTFSIKVLAVELYEECLYKVSKIFLLKRLSLEEKLSPEDKVKVQLGARSVKEGEVFLIDPQQCELAADSLMD